MNSYNDLDALKRNLDSSGSASNFTTSHNTELLALLLASSRMIDRYTNRFFYVDATTRYYNGRGRTVFIDDLLSVTTLKTDEDGDGTFENTLTSTDYFLYPLNELPYTTVEINPNGDFGSLGSGIQKGLEIAGNFGYGDGVSTSPYVDSTSLLNEVGNITASVTSFTVDDGTDFSVGQTILLDSEQMYITSIATHVLTITRGVNGTTAATHDNDTIIYIYVYPAPIEEACLIQAMRWWSRKDTSFADVISVPELGGFGVTKGLDPDVKEIINNYRKKVL